MNMEVKWKKLVSVETMFCGLAMYICSHFFIIIINIQLGNAVSGYSN